ncbi:MAG: arsenate reductase family protein [Clostridium sp.]|uniref:arsenate reductase family protein n=1 Tax=uncultured Clostridium sp. TaxID=59620 RepID=UPI00267256F7|nr:arsenate reductase family protein [uncultured Clostridium sp.]
MSKIFVNYPKCSTCKRAEKFLKENKVEFVNRNIVEENPTAEELSLWMDKSGLEPRKFFNTSGVLYREMNLKDKIKTMSKEEMIEILSTNGMLVKRPLLVTEDIVLVGFKEENYKEII